MIFCCKNVYLIKAQQFTEKVTPGTNGEIHLCHIWRRMSGWHEAAKISKEGKAVKKLSKQTLAFLMAVLMVPVFYVLPAKAYDNKIYFQTAEEWKDHRYYYNGWNGYYNEPRISDKKMVASKLDCG